MRILGIETSCDETAAAVYDGNANRVLSHVLSSQIALHSVYGGVVPELASRAHVQQILPLIHEALARAQISLAQLDVVAVTSKPGLPGSLLIGVATAKTLAWAVKKPLLGINHLEGHIFSACLENTIPFPFLCLTASGGHTSLYVVHNFGEYTLLANTLDDAAGEAFDKVAKLLKLPYPGGPIIEKLARSVAFQDFFAYPRGKAHALDFSFSGLKTAVLYDLVRRGYYNLATRQLHDTVDETVKAQVASSLLGCVKDIFIQKLAAAVRQGISCKAVVFVGGVACNAFIKEELKSWCHERGLSFFYPSPSYCTDNAAMIAFVGHYRALRKQYDDYTLDIL